MISKEKKEFYKQLKEFKEDTSYFHKYESADLRGDTILIQLFKYRKKSSEKSTILIPTQEGLKASKDLYGSQLTNIGLVIKTSSKLFIEEELEIKQGDLIVFPLHKITGKMPNPDFIALQQFSNMGGAKEVVVPDWMEENLPAIQVNWMRYVFTLPHEYDKPFQNCFTFAIPSTELMYKWES